MQKKQSDEVFLPLLDDKMKIPSDKLPLFEADLVGPAPVSQFLRILALLESPVFKKILIFGIKIQIKYPASEKNNKTTTK